MVRHSFAFPRNVALFVILVIFILSCSPDLRSDSQSDNGFKNYSLAIEQYQAKNFEDALDYINAAIKSNDRIAVYFELKGDIYSGLDKLNEALAVYHKAQSMRSYYPEIFVKTGDIYFKKHDYNSAIRDFRKAIAQKPQEPDLILLLVNCYLQQYEYEVGLNLLDDYNSQVNKLNIDHNAEYYILLAKIKFEQKNYAEAVSAGEEARKIKKLSRNECLFFLRSMIKINKLEEAYSLAIKDYKDVLLESDIHFIRGLYYYRKGNYNDARVQLELSVQKKTKIHEAYILLSKIYKDKGHQQLADQCIKNGQPYKSNRLINIDLKY